MTEEKIERRVEAAFDALDARFMAGKLTQEEYDAEAIAVGDWAERQYQKETKRIEARGNITLTAGWSRQGIRQ